MPKPNLSFNDNRSVNVLPFGRNVPDRGTAISDSRSRESQTAPKVLKPNNYNQGFALASPEEFLAQSWAAKSGNNASSNDKKGNPPSSGSLGQARKPETMANNASGTEARNIPASAAPSATSTSVRQPSEKSTGGNLVDSSNDIVHSTPIQVGNEFGGNFVMIGSGFIHIKTVDNNPQTARIVQIEVLGKILLEEPLIGSLALKLDFCTVSFCSGIEGHRIKWILTASQPEIAAIVVEALERLKLQSTHNSPADVSVKGNVSEMETFEEVDSLISFADEDATPPQAVSQFTEDLFSLMGSQFIEDAVHAINVKIELNSTLVAGPEVLSICDVEDAQKPQKTFRGLAASRFADNVVEVGDFLNRSHVFQKLPDSTAAFIKDQVSRRFFEAQKDACDQEVFELVKQQPRKQYSVEKLMSLRNQVSSATKPSEMDPCGVSSPRDEPRPLFSFPELAHVVSENHILPTLETATPNNLRTTHLSVPIVSGREAARKLPGLTISKYGSPRSEVAFQESSKSKELEPPASKPVQELPNLKKPDPRAPKPIQGLSTSKYASPNAGTPFRGPLNTKKLKLPIANRTHGLESPIDRPNHTAKAFQSFLNSQGSITPSLKPFEGPSALNIPGCPTGKIRQGLETSQFPDTLLVQSFEVLSISNHSELASSKPIQELSTPDHIERPITKPYQGLASSRYASPVAAKNGAKKTNVSTPAQSDPKNQAVVVKSSILNATLADAMREEIAQTGIATQEDSVRLSILSMIMDSKESEGKGSKAVDPKVLTEVSGIGEPPPPISSSWNNLRRLDSFNSHVSKDSNETVKAPLSISIMESTQDHTVPLQSLRAGSGHQSILSMDSSAGCESFATAIKETSTKGQAICENNQGLMDGKQPTCLQAGTSNSVLFPYAVTRPEIAGTELRIKSSYSSGMTELIGDSFASIPQPDLSGAKSAPSSKPFNFPAAPARKPIAKNNGGLMSSRYATAIEGISSGVVKQEPEPSLRKRSNKVEDGTTTEKLGPKPAVRDAESNTLLQGLKPTASQFTPSISRGHANPTHSLAPPVMSIFSPSLQPVTATVMVPDPHWPGSL
jgi:hypothetical protein